MILRTLTLPAYLLLMLCTASAAAQSFTDVALGSSHICAIADSGAVECKTRPGFTRYGITEGLPQMIDIAAGDQHTCGIDLEGNAVCWGGDGAFGELDVPEIPQPLTSIAAGDHHNCAIDVNNRVWCWGLDTNRQTQPPGDGLGDNGAGFVKVEGGLNYSCGIQSDGDIACWTTDTRMGDTSNIAGPFIDLDLSFDTACGLTSDGSIDCWYGQVPVPDDGPYIDLAVSRFTVCGLRQDQTIDCRYDSRITPEEPAFAADAQFISIESSSEVFAPATPFCAIRASGSIDCTAEVLTSRLSVPDGTGETGRGLSGINLVLTAERYSSDQLELFWNQPPLRFGRDQILIEIYRNDILVETTENGYSWFDSSEQSENPVTYKIRATNRQGDFGPFSAPVIIDNETGIVTSERPETQFALRPIRHTVDSIRLVLAGNNSVLIWSGSLPGSDGLRGYEVRLNNRPVAFNNGFVQQLESIDLSRCNTITVAAVSDEDTVFDYQTIVTNRLSRDFTSSNCASRIDD